MRSFLPILILVVLGRVSAEGSKETIWKGFSVSCINDEQPAEVVVSNASVSCHGIRLVRKIVQKLLEDVRKKRSMEFFNGISLMEKEDVEKSSRNARFLKEHGPVKAIVEWLEGRELRIKLPTLLPANLESAFEKSLPSSDEGRGKGDGGGGFGGGGKKGDGGVMLMALMMGKMMAAMGFGALAFLAMKALMVAALALMLSLIVAAKKLSSGKEEDSHHVVYAQEISHGHHRRRRSLEDYKNHPYQSYFPATVDFAKQF